MRRSATFAAAALLALGAAPTARAQTTRSLYVSAAQYTGGTLVQTLFGTVDPLTGAFTQLGATTVGFTTLTVTSTGAVYGTASSRLYQINPLNGTYTSVVSMTGPGSASLLGLAATGGTLTGRDGTATAGLVTVDPATGVTSAPRGALGADDVRDVLTQGDDGLLYLVGDSVVAGTYSNTLSTVDLLTGAKSFIGSAAYADLAGLTDVGAASLFGFGTCLTPAAQRNCVVEVNRSTGAITRTSRQSGYLILSAAAAPLGSGVTPPTSTVPEPASLALVAAGAGVLAAVRRRGAGRAG